MKGIFVMCDNREKIGNRVQEIRKARKISQKELATKLSIKPTTLGNYERGERPMNSDLIDKIGIVLNVPRSLIYDGIPEELSSEYTISDLVRGGKEKMQEYFSNLNSYYSMESEINLSQRSDELITFIKDLNEMHEIDGIESIETISTHIMSTIIARERLNKISALNTTNLTKNNIDKLNEYNPFEELKKRHKENQKSNYHIYIGNNSKSKLHSLIKEYDNHIPTKLELQEVLDKIEQENNNY